MTDHNTEQEALACNFCGKSEDEVERLIAGPGVNICEDCVDACNAMLQEHAESGGSGDDN